MKIPVIKNTVTNYLNAGVRLLQGILISRWIIGYLGMEYYGLWTLLWSFAAGFRVRCIRAEIHFRRIV